MRSLRLVLPVVVSLLVASGTPAQEAAVSERQPTQGIDLAARYPAAIDWTENCEPVEWTCEPEDVWSLSSFSYALGGKLRLETGPATLVIGRSGTSALLAAVFPDEPGIIAAAPSAAGERIASLWLRFNPARIGELFPATTVVGQGLPTMLLRGRRLASWKMDSVWMQDFLPSVPWMPSLTFDIDTPEAERRVYSVHTDTGDVTYEPFYKGMTLPPDSPVEPAAAVFAYEAACATIGRVYPAFANAPGLDWAQTTAKFRPAAQSAGTAFGVAQAVADAAMLLRDAGLTVAVGKERAINFTPPRPIRAHFGKMRDAAVEQHNAGPGALYMRRADGIAVVHLTDATNPIAAEGFDAALERAAPSWGLIIDLRFCADAAEDVSQRIAGRFLSQPTVYALSRERKGPAPGDLSEPQPRTCEPRGPWRYQSPVVVITGRQTTGGAELLALMLIAAGATSVGDQTGGLAAERETFEFGGPAMDIRVTIPTRLDLTPQAQMFWGTGLPPYLYVEDGAAYARPNPSDEAYFAAVKRLGAIPGHERRPGKR